jgi:hypothetical protein
VDNKVKYVNITQRMTLTSKNVFHVEEYAIASFNRCDIMGRTYNIMIICWNKI